VRFTGVTTKFNVLSYSTDKESDKDEYLLGSSSSSSSSFSEGGEGAVPKQEEGNPQEEPDTKPAATVGTVVSVPQSASTASYTYRTPTGPHQPYKRYVPSIGTDGEFHPAMLGSWKPWNISAFYTDTNMNLHEHFLVALPSGVGYANSNDVTVALEPDGSATYLAIKYLVPQWIVGEHFLPFLKGTLWESLEEVFSRLPTAEAEAFRQQFENNFVLLAQSFCYQLATLRTNPEGLVKEMTDGTKIRVDMEVQPLKFTNWEIIGNKADGICFLYVDLKAAVNEHSQDKNQVKVAKLEGGGK